MSVIDFDEMSDFEVTVQLAASLHPECNHAHTVKENGNGEAEFWCSNPIGDTVDAGKYNYCNSWLDIGPLIEKYFDHLMSEDEFGVAVWDQCMAVYDDITPKRAAAICIIKLLEAQQ